MAIVKPTGTTAPASRNQPEIVDVEQVFDISSERALVVQQVKNSDEIDKLTSQISIDDITTIVTFGGSVAEEISKASDVVLNNMSMQKIDESSEMLTILSGIMGKFDIDEIKEKDSSFFGKMFGSVRKQLDKILSKYQTMGGEVDKIYVQLKKYEDEINKNNKTLELMFQSNVACYHELVKYILAGEQGITEIENYIAERRADLEATGDAAIQFELTSLEQAQMMLEQRTQDLRIAENIAMQSVPMIKTMQFSNVNLVRKINSAFIITLPIFKQALAQAIMLKRQRIQADAMSALDEKTNEMLLKNAQNTAAQSTMIAKMASGGAVQIETLEKSWDTIMRGIEETQAIQENAKIQRKEDQVRLNAIKADFEKHYSKK